MKYPTSDSIQRLHILPVLSVAIVVVTIGAAFGVLSGRGAMIGMFSAALMVLITSLVGGSRYGITSPTGPMTAALAVILLADQEWIMAYYPEYDPVALMNIIVLLAGLLLALFSFLGIHKAVKWVPQLAIAGFVNGIAVLILISQISATAGLNDALLMIVTLILSVLASRWDNEQSHLVWRIFASSFGVIVLMTLLSSFFQLPVSYLDLTQTFAFADIGGWTWEYFSSETIWIIFVLALELALIALLDTLLTAVIIDKKTGMKTQHRRELFGQSLSFLALSSFGGLPGAQSTVPSMMMVEEKNHHPYSKLLLAFMCIALTFLFADILQFIPSAVFGGIIIKIAIDVADFTSFKSIISTQHPKRFAQLILVIAVLVSTVMISLNLAVIGCTIFFMLWNHLVPKSWVIPDLVAGKESEGLTDEI